MGFGQKKSYTPGQNILRFGAKVIGGASNFGAKVAHAVGNTVGSVANIADKALNIASVIPGVGSLTAPVRAGVQAAQGIASSAKTAGDVLNFVSNAAKGVRESIEK